MMEGLSYKLCRGFGRFLVGLVFYLVLMCVFAFASWAVTGLGNAFFPDVVMATNWPTSFVLSLMFIRLWQGAYDSGKKFTSS